VRCTLRRTLHCPLRSNPHSSCQRANQSPPHCTAQRTSQRTSRFTSQGTFWRPIFASLNSTCLRATPARCIISPASRPFAYPSLRSRRRPARGTSGRGRACRAPGGRLPQRRVPASEAAAGCLVGCLPLAVWMSTLGELDCPHPHSRSV